LLGQPENYNRELALYEEDLLGFVKETQDAQWQKFCKLYPNNPEQKFLERVASQLNKADPNAANKEMRTFGTLGVLRHGLRDRGTRFSLCQFRPEHELNPDTLARYETNRLRVVPELVYSPWAVSPHPNRSPDHAVCRYRHWTALCCGVRPGINPAAGRGLIHAAAAGRWRRCC